MLAFANAKINIGLNITARRPDGYHEIETVFYPVQVKDVVELTDATTLSCVVAGSDFTGAMEDNICFKAFKLLSEDFNLPAQQITLLKHIPVGAGLGGGSSDGANVIKLLNAKFNLGLSVEAMEGYASKLGADCPFFILNKPVYAAGIGDKFEALALDLTTYQLVIITPPIHVSTAEAYAGVVPNAITEPLPELMNLPVAEWKGRVKNDFEASVFLKYPSIKQVKEDLYAAGALYASLSGSGSSVYGLFEEETTLPKKETKLPKKEITLPELEAINKVYYNV